MRILFMGTPNFAKRSLEAILTSGNEICGVITKKDMPVGRKRIITPSEVKVFATENGLDVYQPETLKDEAFAKLLDTLAPDIIVVVAYGKILPSYVLSYPKYGCINVHGSLLPKYRGAAPIQRAMLSGDDITGVTTMYMDEGMDTGDMILSKELKISETENLEELYARLADLGAKLLIETLDMIKSGKIERKKQDNTLATVAPKLTKEDERLDLNQSTKLVMRKINCMLPSPAANIEFMGKVTKIYAAEPCYGSYSDCEASTLAATDKNSITLKTLDGAIRVTQIMQEGGKRMPVSAFLCGNKPQVGMKIN